MQQPNPLQLSIGEYQVRAIPTGIFGLDGGAMFGTVPKVLWEKTNPPDEHNRIPMEARALLLTGRDKNILVDVGNGHDFVAKYGDKLGQKFGEMYQVKGNGLLENLKKYGLTPADITHVILTHLHFDHAGGGTCEREGRIVPTFPKAQYYVQRKNLETAKAPNLRERASYLEANYQPLLDAGCLTLLDGAVENLLPGISVFISNGHTEGQQLVKVSDGKKTLVYCGDLVPTSSHVRLPFIMGYDLHPLTIIEEKRQLLAKASQGNWFLYFEHDPYCDLATVSFKDPGSTDSDFRLNQIFQLQ